MLIYLFVCCLFAYSPVVCCVFVAYLDMFVYCLLCVCAYLFVLLLVVCLSVFFACFFFCLPLRTLFFISAVLISSLSRYICQLSHCWICLNYNYFNVFQSLGSFYKSSKLIQVREWFLRYFFFNGLLKFYHLLILIQTWWLAETNCETQKQYTSIQNFIYIHIFAIIIFLMAR